MINDANTQCDEIISLGDMNANYLDRNNNRELKSIIEKNGFKQLITTPTRITNISSTLIDIIITNKENNVAKTFTSAQSMSDHDMICCVRKINYKHTNPRTITCRNFTKYDPNLLMQDLANTDFAPLYKATDVNKAWNYLKGILTEKFNKHAPIMTKRVKGTFCPWLTPEIKRYMNNRDRTLRKFRKSKTDNDWDDYKELRNSCTNQIRKARSTYHQNLLVENRKNPQTFWKIIKKIFPSSKSTTKSSGASVSSLTSNKICDFFTTIAGNLKKLSFPLRELIWEAPKTIKSVSATPAFAFTYVSTLFVEGELKKMKRTKSTGIDDLPTGMLKDCRTVISTPLTFIINMSLQTSTVPSEWKTALITPIHKKGSKTDANNYRPISILPVVSKILEKAVQQQLMDHLESNNLLSDKQFGYRKQRSTDIAATLFTDNIRKACDKGLVSGALFIDLSKAFDTLGHHNILTKLEKVGIKGLSLQWFTDYLFSRRQCVKFNNELSDPSTLLCGVPQGSILGPILFLIFFNDFECCLQQCEVIQFADDTVVYFSAKSTEQVERVINSDLKNISAYFYNNELVINLNLGKTECMLMGTSKRIANLPKRELELFYSGSKINCTTTYKYLGTQIDYNLNFAGNFEKKVRKASSKLHVLKHLKPLLTKEASIMVYNSYFLSNLRYNCILNLNLTLTQKKQPTNLETRASKILNFNVAPIANELYKHGIKLVRKCAKGKICSNFIEYFQINFHNKRTRNKDLLLKIPKVKLELAKSGFFFMGAKLYNLLPRDIRLSETEADFIKKVKLYLLDLLLTFITFIFYTLNFIQFFFISQIFFKFYTNVSKRTQLIAVFIN